MKYLLVFISGLALRIYTCINSSILNLDGIHYIYQAKAIYYGRWETITDCFLKYLSNYPIFIAGAYSIDPDMSLRTWIDGLAADLDRDDATAPPPLVEASLRHTLGSLYGQL